jgi:16S rRNA (uracil1498-N3)-methyltransferase
MNRFYVPPDQCLESFLTLPDEEAHHALNVLRLRRGDAAVVLDGAGTELECAVADASRHAVRLAVKSRRTAPPLPFQLTLLQAIPKGKLLNSIIQKATELGASRVVPLLTERVVTHLDDDKSDARRDHWQHVAIEAIKQCGAPWLPRVEAATTAADFLTRGEAFDLPLIASLQPGAKHPREHFDAFRREHGRQPASLCVWVGPEGDFTPEEVAAVLAAGARAITLGPLVLRSDTAAVYCLSALSYEMQTTAPS